MNLSIYLVKDAGGAVHRQILLSVSSNLVERIVKDSVKRSFRISCSEIIKIKIVNMPDFREEKSVQVWILF